MALGEMKSFLDFAEALMWAGSTMSRPLPDAVVVTRAVHACVEGDKVTERMTLRESCVIDACCQAPKQCHRHLRRCVEALFILERVGSNGHSTTVSVH